MKQDMTGFTDADGSMAEDRHAISRYAFLIHGGAITWSAKWQEIIALSTTEAEYVAITHASKEALWLRFLVFQLFDIVLELTTLFSDNKSAIELTKDHQYHAWTKHIDIQFHFIHWIIKEGSFHLVYCPTNEMIADMLTKALPSAKAKHFASQLRLLPAWGGVLEYQADMALVCHISVFIFPQQHSLLPLNMSSSTYHLVPVTCNGFTIP